jgi:hypothetical protein
MFELNDNPDVTIKKVGPQNRTIVIVDNFYKNPDEVRDLALKSERKREQSLINGLPGQRVFQKTSEVKDKLKPFFDKYCLDNSLWSKHTHQKMYEFQWDAVGFMCNVLNYHSVFHAPWCSIPHQDSYMNDITTDFNQFGVVIYLNTPDECQGGTNLYSYKGQMSVPYNVMDYIDKPEGFDDEVTKPEQCYPYIREWLYGDREWKVEYEAEMVYNRCIFYESDVMHSQNIDHGMFTEHDRVNQVFFL